LFSVMTQAEIFGGTLDDSLFGMAGGRFAERFDVTGVTSRDMSRTNITRL